MDYPRQAPQDPEGEVEHALRACPMFRDWPADPLRALARSGRMRRYRRHAQIVVSENRRRDFCVIVSGSIEVAAANAAGNKYILAVLGPGQVTGLVQLLDDVPMASAFHAREDAQVVHVPIAALRKLLDAEPILWRSIALLTLRRFSLSAKCHHDQALGSVRRRVAKTLINLAHRYGDLEVDACSTELRLSQSELANMLGVSRQTVGKELVRLRDEGIVGGDARYRLISLLDIPGLLRIADAE